jgi:hypothetical protein
MAANMAANQNFFSKILVIYSPWKITFPLKFVGNKSKNSLQTKIQRNLSTNPAKFVWKPLSGNPWKPPGNLRGNSLLTLDFNPNENYIHPYNFEGKIIKN